MRERAARPRSTRSVRGRLRSLPHPLLRKRRVGAARARRVLRNRGLTVVAAPADTTTRFGWKTSAPGWRTADRGVEELTGRDIVACLEHSPGHRAVRAGARLEYAMSLNCHQE